MKPYTIAYGIATVQNIPAPYVDIVKIDINVEYAMLFKKLIMFIGFIIKLITPPQALTGCDDYCY